MAWPKPPRRTQRHTLRNETQLDEASTIRIPYFLAVLAVLVLTVGGTGCSAKVSRVGGERGGPVNEGDACSGDLSSIGNIVLAICTGTLCPNEVVKPAGFDF